MNLWRREERLAEFATWEGSALEVVSNRNSTLTSLTQKREILTYGNEKF